MSPQIDYLSSSAGILNSFWMRSILFTRSSSFTLSDSSPVEPGISILGGSESISIVTWM